MVCNQLSCVYNSKINAYHYEILYVGGEDYIFRDRDIKFYPGVTKKMFNILIIDDNLVEDNETFILSIDPKSLRAGVISRYPSEIVVTIVDNDGEFIYVCSM